MHLDKRLARVERLATAGKLQRLWHNPMRYMSSLAFAKLIYPRSRKALLKQVVTFFDTPMEVLLPAGLDIYLTGGKTHDSEIRLARYMLQHIQPGQTYIDVGAHFGYYTLLASKLVGNDGHVYAFEAANNTYEVLKHNVDKHKNIQALHNAVSDTEEVISFYEFPILYSEYNSMNIEQFQDEAWIAKYKPQKTDVRAVTLDLFTETIYQQPNFIKIDVEGAEDKVIHGCSALLQKHSPVVVMEFLSESRHNAVHFEALSILKQYNYQCHAIDKAGMTVEIGDVTQYLQTEKLESDNFVFLKK